jgi:hypothetical protein
MLTCAMWTLIIFRACCCLIAACLPAHARVIVTAHERLVADMCCGTVRRSLDVEMLGSTCYFCVLVSVLDSMWSSGVLFKTKLHGRQAGNAVCVHCSGLDHSRTHHRYIDLPPH